MDPFELCDTHLQFGAQIPSGEIFILIGISFLVLRTQIDNFYHTCIQADLLAEILNFAFIDIWQAGTNQNPIGFAFIDQLLQMLPSAGGTGLLDKFDTIDQWIRLEPLNYFLGVDCFQKPNTTGTNDHEDLGYFSQYIGWWY